MDAATLESLIQNAIPDAEIRVEDSRGDGAHFTATVAARSFAGKTRIQQHRAVHAALKSVGDKVAISIQTVVAEK